MEPIVLKSPASLTLLLCIFSVALKAVAYGHLDVSGRALGGLFQLADEVDVVIRVFAAYRPDGRSYREGALGVDLGLAEAFVLVEVPPDRFVASFGWPRPWAPLSPRLRRVP